MNLNSFKMLNQTCIRQGQAREFGFWTFSMNWKWLRVTNWTILYHSEYTATGLPYNWQARVQVSVQSPEPRRSQTWSGSSSPCWPWCWGEPQSGGWDLSCPSNFVSSSKELDKSPSKFPLKSPCLTLLRLMWVCRFRTPLQSGAATMLKYQDAPNWDSLSGISDYRLLSKLLFFSGHGQRRES